MQLGEEISPEMAKKMEAGQRHAEFLKSQAQLNQIADERQQKEAILYSPILWTSAGAIIGSKTMKKNGAIKGGVLGFASLYLYSLTRIFG